jgi:hypothetical protein
MTNAWGEIRRAKAVGENPKDEIRMTKDGGEEDE